MRQSRLQSMVRIAGQTTRQRERTLRESRDELQRLATQHDAMRQLVRQYRDEAVGTESLDPRSLAHRHAFSAQLAHLVSDIGERVERQANRCEQDQTRLDQASARELAVESVLNHETQRLDLERRRQEQREVDDISGERHARQRRGSSTGE